MTVGPATYFDPGRADGLDLESRLLIDRRAAVLGATYRLFYEHPVEFVRGSGTTLWDRDGNAYLDAYNNVPSVGHAHPRVVEAIAKQAAQLNTHTRYLDEGIVRYAEQLLDTVPMPMRIVFTCTGSEANDLALRIAKAVTGREQVIVTDYAYHGVTAETAAVSPSLVGAGGLAPWAVAAPVDALAAAVDRPAAILLDTILSSDGVLPDAPIASAVAAARAAGGLFIADEVQPGFGRLGHGMWGFTRHGVEPDIITIGKPMGNGQPIAAVLARPELLEEFSGRERYFNTFGGNPVSIAAAQATLDVLRDEQLIENAATVGAYLAEQLRGMGLTTRQAGLFLGIEVGEDAVGVVNRMRERRVLISTTGPANTALKIRPPLPFSVEDADRLLTELEASL